jgi:hypothetical protein
MNGKYTLLNSKEKETSTPSVSAAMRIRLQPTVELVLTMVMMADAVVILAALWLGFLGTLTHVYAVGFATCY